MARPSQYSDIVIPAVKAAAFFGATRAEIAAYLGITRQCFSQWCAEHEELNNVLKRGSEASDNRVVESLYHLAVGWNGQPPNVTAAIFWLKNRRPSEWRDVQHIDQVTGHYIISDKPMTEEEWITARADRAQPVQQAVTQSVSPVLDTSDDQTAKPLD